MSEHDMDGKQMDETSTEEVSQEESSTSEVNVEELQAEISKQNEEIERLKGHLRNKEEKKDKQKAEAPALPEDVTQKLSAIEEKLSKQEQNLKETAVNRMLATDWGTRYDSESDPNGESLARLNEALKIVNAANPALSAEDYDRNLRKAHLLITDELESAVEQAERKESVAGLKREASIGTTGSSFKRDSVDDGLTDSEKKMLERAEQYAKKFKR